MSPPIVLPASAAPIEAPIPAPAPAAAAADAASTIALMADSLLASMSISPTNPAGVPRRLESANARTFESTTFSANAPAPLMANPPPPPAPTASAAAAETALIVLR